MTLESISLDDASFLNIDVNTFSASTSRTMLINRGGPAKILCYFEIPAWPFVSLFLKDLEKPHVDLTPQPAIQMLHVFVYLMQCLFPRAMQLNQL